MKNDLIILKQNTIQNTRINQQHVSKSLKILGIIFVSKLLYQIRTYFLNMKTITFYLALWCLCTCIWSCQNANSTRIPIQVPLLSQVLQETPIISPNRLPVNSITTIRG